MNYKEKEVKKSDKKLQIVVLGSSSSICTEKAYNMAFETGKKIAEEGYVCLTGGGHGVMEAALKGAKSAGGITLSIVPWEDKNESNDYSDITVATGIGWSRNSININSADGCIVIGGGAGTLNEVTYAYMMRKPTVALTPSGGMAETVHDAVFDKRETEIIEGVNTPIEAVETIVKLIHKKKEEGVQISDFDKKLLEKIQKDKDKTGQDEHGRIME